MSKAICVTCASHFDYEFMLCMLLLEGVELKVFAVDYTFALEFLSILWTRIQSSDSRYCCLCIVIVEHQLIHLLFLKIVSNLAIRYLYFMGKLLF